MENPNTGPPLSLFSEANEYVPELHNQMRQSSHNRFFPQDRHSAHQRPLIHRSPAPLTFRSQTGVPLSHFCVSCQSLPAPEPPSPHHHNSQSRHPAENALPATLLQTEEDKCLSPHNHPLLFFYTSSPHTLLKYKSDSFQTDHFHNSDVHPNHDSH